MHRQLDNDNVPVSQQKGSKTPENYFKELALIFVTDLTTHCEHTQFIYLSDVLEQEQEANSIKSLLPLYNFSKMFDKIFTGKYYLLRRGCSRYGD